ncbi:MAG TPA: ATP-binding protein [Vicinamibacterales bacterium]|nr:ATP-binding protein [Vicinamibacterales bacterium]
MATPAASHTAVCLSLTRAIGRSRTVDEIYDATLDALAAGLGIRRASILLFDADGVMRFKAYRGISERYRRAVEGHTPWRPDTRDAEPIVVPDVTKDASLRSYLPVFAAEQIAGLVFIPLVSLDGVIGKFMLYLDRPGAPGVDEMQLAGLIAAQVAFAVERTRTEAQAKRSEARLRFALDAAEMGTWDWDLSTNAVVWSDNLERIHGLPPGTFDGTFASYEKEIHPDDRGRVLASIQHALNDGAPHEVEYRLVAPDGTVRWCEGKGRVEYQGDRPASMSGVCMMVTRRKEAELARLAAAEDASRHKDEFLATLSHELRTPLNAILGWVQMIAAGQLSPERTRQAIDVIARNARLQQQLIEDILDVSRIITGKLQIERIPVAVPGLLDTVVAGASPDAEAKQIAFVQRVEPELPPIEGDPKRLHQILGNVLSNAIKFSARGGTIELTCGQRDGSLEISIRDQGAGIAPEFLPYVFDRFRQADSRSTRRHGGLGLGLAIARHLVEEHGGDIRADSEGPGRGTTITIRLPVGLADEALAGARPVAKRSVANVSLGDLKVLVVDDQLDSREMLGALLESRGARVIQCDSAAAALNQLPSQAIDLVIADIAMPGVDGYELLQRVRKQGHTMPAIAVTAFARPDDRDRALAAGFTAYCAKPIDAAQLIATVRGLVAAT